MALKSNKIPIIKNKPQKPVLIKNHTKENPKKFEKGKINKYIKKKNKINSIYKLKNIKIKKGKNNFSKFSFIGSEIQD